jgi:menaquinone-dependent protoporphyrinogen oxidase
LVLMLTTPPRILVTYGSRFGTTGGIAERIGTRLRASGYNVDVRRVEDVIDVDSYAAVILGSGVYNGSWTLETSALVRRLAASLSRRAVWFFSAGTFGDRHPLIGRLIRREPREIGEFTSAIRPRGYRVFAGVIDVARWPWFAKAVLTLLGGGAGDRRDWADIDAWTDTIAHDLAALACPCCRERPVAVAS